MNDESNDVCAGLSDISETGGDKLVSSRTVE